MIPVLTNTKKPLKQTVAVARKKEKGKGVVELSRRVLPLIDSLTTNDVAGFSIDRRRRLDFRCATRDFLRCREIMGSRETVTLKER